MCRPTSFVWSKSSDSHEDIIRELEREKGELVEACKDAISAVDSSDKVADFVSSCELGEAINRMRAAIKKAEGKE